MVKELRQKRLYKLVSMACGEMPRVDLIFVEELVLLLVAFVDMISVSISGVKGNVNCDLRATSVHAAASLIYREGQKRSVNIGFHVDEVSMSIFGAPNASVATAMKTTILTLTNVAVVAVLNITLHGYALVVKGSGKTMKLFSNPRKSEDYVIDLLDRPSCHWHQRQQSKKWFSTTLHVARAHARTHYLTDLDQSEV